MYDFQFGLQFNKYILHSQYLLKINLLDDFFFFFFLTAPCGMRDLISPTRAQTPAPCSGISESEPLDCQGTPLDDF